MSSIMRGIREQVDVDDVLGEEQDTFDHCQRLLDAPFVLYLISILTRNDRNVNLLWLMLGLTVLLLLMLFLLLLLLLLLLLVVNWCRWYRIIRNKLRIKRLLGISLQVRRIGEIVPVPKQF